MNNDVLLSELSNNEKLLVNSQVQSKGKNIVLAYVFAFFFGLFGIHRFYMGKTVSAIAMLLITVLSVGFLAIISGIWTFVDLFLIPRWIKNDNARIEREAAEAIINDPKRAIKEV
ncbi:TM2 domain-containing membrane protein YozV [Weissella uvarum]|uniref:TM2 domain-containing protein n=1 Tax=Weissella uvarum TaxID=1479233 RepID=UPI001961AD9C|nr:TM2 domain-containing protein [Weissella uvarum]MBM7617478.1 TM2 domain-containing membrane protein YozV [Weissella uvarum]MCM0595637.1 TM2 domain-containing protein [Weissella uvarum]